MNRVSYMIFLGPLFFSHPPMRLFWCVSISILGSLLNQASLWWGDTNFRELPFKW